MEKFVVQAAVLIARHDVIPFDLTVVDVCDGQRLFSFLCIEWGIIADVDCDSEQYRFLGKDPLIIDHFKNPRKQQRTLDCRFSLGAARFTVEAVKRILRKFNNLLLGPHR